MKPSRQTFRIGVLVFIFSFLRTVGTALAGHPLGTEDAETKGRGNVEVEFNCERSHGREGSRLTSLGNIYTLGLLPKVDLALSFAYRFDKPDAATPADRGFGDTQATLKTSFHDGMGWMPTLGIKAGVLLPTGDEAKGLGDGRTKGLLTLIADWKIENLKIHANVGNELTMRSTAGRARDTKAKASLAAEWEPKENWVLVIETSWEKDSGIDKHGSDFLVGGKKELVENLTLDVGIRWGLSTASPTSTYLAGLTLAFQGERPSGKNPIKEPEGQSPSESK
jgi:uncharacterized protein Veg